MISRIEAYKYRCFDKLDIQVGQYNVLVGLNGTGKSTLIDIPLLLSEILSKGLVPAFLESPSIPGGRRVERLRHLLYKQQGDNFGFAIEAHLPQEVISQLLKPEALSAVTTRNLHPQSVRYEINLKIVSALEIHVNHEYLYIINYKNFESGVDGKAGIKEFFHKQAIVKRDFGNQAIVIPENNIGDRIEFELEPQELVLANFPQDFPNPATLWLKNFLEKEIMCYEPSKSMLRKAFPPSQQKTLRYDAANLPWLVLNLQKEQPNLFDYWVEHIKMGFPNLQTIQAVQSEENNYAYLQLKYSGEHIVTSSELSYGTLNILALTILPYLPQIPGVILVEEPVHGIHPRLIEIVLQSLSSLYDSQIFMSTYSPVVLAHTDLKSVIVMKESQENGATAIPGDKHPRFQDWQGSIDLGSLFAAGVLG
ncbi:AAA family ATPase [Scytonema sp. UIC 10036]|uniref:methylation-associated defense system AAA family ATPase MAD3 n=1 Tax=Scytonema sp. UIC 10036 TaxID=2304196 RepID=UPI0012DAA047|nr:ATP-binding protein [Scytonema sp. UIC 10036]MUG94457.1 AAA family ATPase [Scytonema sp. UIC 10036]